MESIITSKYRDLLEISDGLIVINKSNTILFISQESSKIFGLNKTELEGRKISDVFENPEVLLRAISKKEYYTPIFLKATNIESKESTSVITVLQVFERTGVGVFDDLLGFILIVCKIPDVEMKGILGTSINFTKQMGTIFLSFHSSLSKGFGGGRFGSTMSAFVLLTILTLGATYNLLKENNGIIKNIQDKEHKEHSSK